MDNTIFLIEQVSCRGDVWENKYKANQSKVVNLFKYLLELVKDNPIDLISEKLEELEYEDKFDEDVIAILYKVSDCWFTVVDEDEYREELQNRLCILEKGEGSLTFEESEVGIGLSPKQAILSMVEIDEEW
jgi:hypothetical protein